jgi:hypothetical protein
MTLGDIIQLVNLKLGEQSTFYTPSEIVAQGINPAQRLLCLAFPSLNYARSAITVTADQPFIDLRTLLDANSVPVGNRFRRVRRIALGDVTDDIANASATTGELRELHASAVKRLAARNNWLSQHGEVRKYWLWGRFWLGLYKRPIDSTTITVVYSAAPAPLVLEVPGGVPDIPAVYHATIADVATGLLLIKEGDPQATRGMERIRAALKMPIANPREV